MDYLAGGNYQPTVVNGHPIGWAAGFILNTNRPTWPVKNMWPCINALAANGQCPWIRVHAIWDDDHMYRNEYARVIFQEHARALTLASDYPGIRVEFSWMCENNMSKAQNLKMVKDLSDPSIHLVNSVYQGAIVPGAKTEIHGPSSRVPAAPYNFSYDGSDTFQDDTVKTFEKFKHADVIFLWSYRMNGHFAAKDGTPRNERKAWMYPALLHALEAMANNPGIPTNPANPKVPIQHLYKAVAEDSGTGDIRANKALVITPIRGRQVNFECDDGTVVGTAQYYGPFVDGRSRYYSVNYGFEIANLAFAHQGHNLVYLKIGRQTIGRVCPTHRASVYK